ncbi:40s ribosomal protein s5-1 [Hordeum vulgare]|nr:40s ribosomal protein s5-1 [Hordeum vulgare]
MEQQVFKCQGMVECGLNANHTMITEFTSNHKMDAIDIGKHLSRLYDRVDQLQGQIYDLRNQNCVRLDNVETGADQLEFFVTFFEDSSQRPVSTGLQITSLGKGISSNAQPLSRCSVFLSDGIG